MSSIASGDDSTFAFVDSRQSMWPFLRSKAVTVPSVELTIRRGPAIAGVDGFGPRPCRTQITRPVRASMAYVRPLNVFTYSVPSQ